MKKCFKCKIKKPIDQFYVHKQMGDGHLGKCKLCTKKDVKERYSDPISRLKIIEYERLRFKTPHRKAKIKEYATKRREKYRGKAKVYIKLKAALRRGELVRLP